MIFWIEVQCCIWHFVRITLNKVQNSGCEKLERFAEQNKELFCQMRHLGSLSTLCLTCLSSEWLTLSDTEQNIRARGHTHRPKDCACVNPNVVFGCFNCFFCAVWWFKAVGPFSLWSENCKISACLLSEGHDQGSHKGFIHVVLTSLKWNLWRFFFFPLFFYMFCPLPSSEWEDLASSAHYANAVHGGTALPICFA